MFNILNTYYLEQFLSDYNITDYETIGWVTTNTYIYRLPHKLWAWQIISYKDDEILPDTFLEQYRKYIYIVAGDIISEHKVKTKVFIGSPKLLFTIKRRRR